MSTEAKYLNDPSIGQRASVLDADRYGLWSASGKLYYRTWANLKTDINAAILIEASQVSAGTFDDARVSESNVTQHQGALAITESQISDFGSYAAGVHSHAASDITSGELASARISEASVTQHQAALAVSFSQISDVAFSTDDTMAAATDAMIYSGLATKTYIADQIAALVDSSPAALDTLNELAAALGDDPNFATTTADALGNRLRVDTDAQGLSGTQQGYGRTNLGLGSMALASSDDYLLLTGGTLTGGIDITNGQLTITNNGTTATNNDLSIIAGNAARSRIFFGDDGSAFIGQIAYNHITNAMNFNVNGSTALLLNSSLDATFSGKVLMPTASGIKGASTGNANIASLNFYESDGTTSQGYVGIASGSAADLFLTSFTGQIKLAPNGVTALTLATSGNATVTGSMTAGSTYQTSIESAGNSIRYSRNGANYIYATEASAQLIIDSPTLKLRNAGTDALSIISGNATFSGQIIQSVSASSGYAMTIANTNLSGSGLRIRGGGTSGTRYLIYGTDYNDTQRFMVDDLGNVTATDFILSSDARLKKNIQPIGGNFFKYEMGGRTRYGTTAQQIEKSHPELVHEDAKGIKSVSYIDMLVMKIAELENRLNKIEA
ncbi:MAG: tail fiber domain-containing protein [Reichenbachiella sp.]